MRISNKKINYYMSLIMMFLASFPTTAFFSSAATTFLRLTYMLGFAWTFIVFIKRRYYTYRKLLPVLVMLPWFIMSSMLNSGSSTQKCAYMCIRMFVVTVLTQHLLEINCRKVLKQIGNFWSLMMFIQLISYLTGFMGVTSTQNNSNLLNYFFGIRVEINEYIIYTIAFAIFASMVGGKKDKVLAVITAISATYFAIGECVSTSISGLAAFVICISISVLIRKSKKWKYIGFIIFIAAVIFPYIMENGIVSWYVVDVVGEDITFNGRTTLWIQAIEQVKGLQMLYGKGFEPISSLWIIGKRAFVVNHPHNNYIQFYYWYGIVGFFMYIYIYIKMIKEVQLISNNRVRLVYMATIISNMIMAVFSRNYWYMTAQIFYVYGMNIEMIDEIVSEGTIVNKNKAIRKFETNRSFRCTRF